MTQTERDIIRDALTIARECLTDWAKSTQYGRAHDRDVRAVERIGLAIHTLDDVDMEEDAMDDGRREALIEADMVDESLPDWVWEWLSFVGLLGIGLLLAAATVWVGKILTAMWGGG